MAGKAVKVDYKIGIALTCKYMGWDWDVYMRQPVPFLEIIDTMRKEEARETERLNKQNG